MKSPASLALTCLLLAAFASAQGRPGGGGGGGGGGGTTGSRPTNPTPNSTPGTRMPTNPMPEIERPLFISGKVVLADGSQISEPAAIETVCGSRRRIETYTDSRGNFSFQLKQKSDTMGLQSADMSSMDDQFARSNRSGQWRDCEVLAMLPGFTSESVALARWMPIMEATDIGRVTLRPISGVQGSVLSVTSLAAPKPARKALEKARDQIHDNKLDAARESLEKAVQIYPQYATAWDALGSVQYMKHDSAAAKHSYEQALAADAKYTKPYLGLAQLNIDAHEWAGLAETTNKLLALDSVGFPVAWYLNAMAYYNLQNFAACETSVLSGLKSDSEHRMPRLEYLMGLLLMHKKDYLQAGSHLREFQRLSTKPEDLAEAQKLLAQIEQLSVNANVAQPPKQ